MYITPLYIYVCVSGYMINKRPHVWVPEFLHLILHGNMPKERPSTGGSCHRTAKICAILDAARCCGFLMVSMVVMLICCLEFLIIFAGNPRGIWWVWPTSREAKWVLCGCKVADHFWETLTAGPRSRHLNLESNQPNIKNPIPCVECSRSGPSKQCVTSHYFFGGASGGV
jgi:hypothetical protein